MYLSKSPFILFTTCRTINGYGRGVIYDLQRANFDLIPLDLFHILKNGRFSWKEIMTNSCLDNQPIYDEYLDFLKNREYVFNMPDSIDGECFSNLSLEWDDASIITNAIVDISRLSLAEFKYSLMLLSSLNCGNVQLWDDSDRSSKTLHKYISCMQTLGFGYVELFKRFNGSEKPNAIKKSVFLGECINSIVLYGADNDSDDECFQLTISDIYNDWNIVYVSPKTFIVNTRLFTEAQQHHTYFNRKLYIGPNGEIKNAPECEESFGNIGDIKDAEELKQIVCTKEFQKYWYVRKDDCDVCKDCEFRYMCTDNRLPQQRKDDSWFHKQECNYNPYICKWKGEEGYRTLSECGVISNESGFSVGTDRIASINTALWEE